VQSKLTKRVADSLAPAARPYQCHDTEIRGFLLRIQPSGQKSWYFEYRNREGRRLRYLIGSYAKVSAEGARSLAKAAAADAAAGVDLQARKKEQRIAGQRAKEGRLKAFLDDRYEPWVKAHLKSGPFSVKRIRADFKDWLERPMSEINSWLVGTWVRDQAKGGKRPSTIRRDVQRLQAALSKAVEWKILDHHPFPGVKLPRIDRRGRVRYLSDAEEAALRKALVDRETALREARDRFNSWRETRGIARLPTRDQTFADHLRPIVLIALNTGLRRGELFNLRWRDIDTASKWLTVRGDSSKSGQTREVPLNDEALTVLCSWRQQSPESDDSALVFPGDEGASLTRIDKSWRGVTTRANLKDFRFHDLRHHFASRLVQAGTDLYTVKELLGHSDLAMVQRYGHLDREKNLRAAVARVAL
jgi:integrase